MLKEVWGQTDAVDDLVRRAVERDDVRRSVRDRRHGLSGLTVAFASNSAPVCTVAGTTVTIVSPGTCSITASQGGNANWNAAPDVTRTFTVSQATLDHGRDLPGQRRLRRHGPDALHRRR